MSKYTILIEVLDKLRGEADGTTFASRYLPDIANIEAVNQSRARAFVHLFLKVSFGLLSFDEREHYFTDGSQDGGIDGYFIQKETRTVFFIQSKFRTTKENFENKRIELDEILVMDVSRIVVGESKDESGTDYNGKIKQLSRELTQIDDIGRYKYKVVLLANLKPWSANKLSQLTGGFVTEVFDFDRSYGSLVFPIISGTFFSAADLMISLDLSNKNAGTKISYEVSTKYNDCEITVLFVPTAEIARVMHRYKNSILKFNPRSYLELEGHSVNSSIRETILENETNEFALYNNGITMLSDETNINERIGQRNKAQLILRNPQIINGGQTAYTLSRIFEEHSGTNPDQLFKGKEVLLKVITLMDLEDRQATTTQKLELIDRISTASNRQTPVITADKNSNNEDHLQIQKVLFDRYGILYERKRGEFADGIHKGYVTTDLMVERNLYFRLYMAVKGDAATATRKKLFMKFENPIETLSDDRTLDRLYFALLCFKRLTAGTPLVGKVTRDKTLYAKLFAMSFEAPNDLDVYRAHAELTVKQSSYKWPQFIIEAGAKRQEFQNRHVDKVTGSEYLTFAIGRWMDSPAFLEDVRALYGREATPEN